MLHRISRPRFSSRREETIWLTIYADLITNLALVFLALFGLTIIGEEALREALLSMRFGELVFDKIESENVKFESTMADLNRDLSTLDGIDIREEPASLRLSFGEEILFRSGRAELRKGSIPLLARVGSLLKDVPYTLVVEGHTDAVPLRASTLYKNNWDLSLARSMSVARALIQAGIPPPHIAAAAYGSYHPRASNSTPEGRRLNRRVEIAIYKDFSL